MSTFRWIVLASAVFLGAGWLATLARKLRQRSAAPSDENNLTGSIISLVVGVGVFLAVWYGFAFMEPPVLFLRALRGGDDRRAFGMLTESAQTYVGGFYGFEEWADSVRPTSWVMYNACGITGRGRSDGTVWLASGERSQVSFSILREDDAWQIEGVHFWDVDRTYWLGTSNGLDCSDD